MKFWYRNVDGMPLWTPSREGDKQPAIDGLLAQHVLGWKEITLSPYGHYYGRPDDSNYGDHRDYDQVPALSETREGLGLVVEAMAAKGWLYEVGQIVGAERKHYAVFRLETIDPIHEDWAAEIDAAAATAPLAVALAALKALDVEVPS